MSSYFLDPSQLFLAFDRIVPGIKNAPSGDRFSGSLSRTRKLKKILKRKTRPSRSRLSGKPLPKLAMVLVLCGIPYRGSRGLLPHPALRTSLPHPKTGRPHGRREAPLLHFQLVKSSTRQPGKQANLRKNCTHLLHSTISYCFQRLSMRDNVREPNRRPHPLPPALWENKGVLWETARSLIRVFSFLRNR